MEQYLRKSTLSSLLNGLGVYAVLMACGQWWFYLLWGVTAASVLAGAALGVLLCMSVKRLRRHAADDRAEMIRRRLGGEMAMEQLLMMKPMQAHRTAAMLLAECYALTLLKADESGVLCTYGGEKLLVQCVARPAECEAGSSDAAVLARACREQQADRGVLCLTCKAGKRLAAYAEECPVPVRVVSRAELVQLAGCAAPATDEQLMALKLRRERCGAVRGLLRTLVHPSKAGRYMGYGLGLMLMYIVTGLRLYPISGALCMGMAVLCRCAKAEPAGL